MQKSAPSVGKIAVAVGFALSCFAILLFLWVTFGGSVPFKPKSYTITVDVEEAITLQKEADVRIGGVSVGKVKDLELTDIDDPDNPNATRATMEIDPAFAPISSDAMATLRQKTLLGETYIELTSGTQFDGNGNPVDDPNTPDDETVDVSTLSGDDAAEPLPEGGHLESSQVVEQVQIDEIFNALDEETRQAFQLWMRNSGIAVNGRGQDLNDALGNIGPFSEDASDVLGTLRQQEQALRGVVRNTGAVFEALTARDQELAGAIVGSNRTFRALASRDAELAETFQILPTFESETRLTLDRLEAFAINAGPLFRDLKPVARDISPTLRDLRRLAPNAKRLFKNTNPLVKVSVAGLPALTKILDQLRPTLVALDPFLSNLNPVVRFLDYHRASLSDFLTNPPYGLAGTIDPATTPNQPSPRHFLRQIGHISTESLSVYPERLATNRGNGYLQPLAIGTPGAASQGALFESFDCSNTSNFIFGGSTTGGLGSGQVSSNPASTPPISEGAYTGAGTGGSSNTSPSAVGESFPLPPSGSFSGCLLPPNYPSEFGGGRVPNITADP